IPVDKVMYILLSKFPLFGNYVPHNFTPSEEVIVWLIRIPDITAAVFVGASLATGGSVVQSIFRNPITEPYIIGISSGATLGAVLALATNSSIFGFYTLQAYAFIFSLLVVGLIYTVSVRRGRTPVTYLLLVGISISFFVSSIVGLMLFSNPKLQNEAYDWLLGSLVGMNWPEVVPVVYVVIICSFLMGLMHRELDALQLGEGHARSVGVRVERTKALSIILTTLSVSAAVSISGLIGFVGLVTPHISRILFGGSNRFVIPVSFFVGAIFLLGANDIARDAVQNSVIPVGIVTGIIGVPFFLFLLGRISRGYYVS
ncbi:MAG: iron ABC transporter permease, partial [Thermoplasmataceae archaeon]